MAKNDQGQGSGFRVHISTATNVVIDGAALVQMLKPGASKTFDDYAHQVFIPYILRQLHTASRLDQQRVGTQASSPSSCVSG